MKCGFTRGGRNCMKGYIEVENPETCWACRFCREIDEGGQRLVVN